MDFGYGTNKNNSRHYITKSSVRKLLKTHETITRTNDDVLMLIQQHIETYAKKLCENIAEATKFAKRKQVLKRDVEYGMRMMDD